MAGLNILYGVVGEGMGHATRSAVVLSHLLKRGHRVKVVASGRAHRFLSERFADVDRIHGLHIVYEDNEVQRRETVLSNLVQLPENLSTNVAAYFELLSGFDPDVVISDFDSFAWMYAQNHRKPIISIDNMQVINRCRHEDVPPAHEGDFRMTRALVKSKLPGCDHYFITTFFHPPVRKRRTTLVPSILRDQILNAAVTDGDGRFTLAAPPTFKVYGLNKSEIHGNVSLHTFSEDGFIADLAGCRAVIANGGFTLMSEAVYLRKPVLSVPVGKQFEQVLNGHYLYRLGYGESWDTLDADTITHFLANVPRYRENLASYRQDGNRELFDALDEALPLLAAGQPLPDTFDEDLDEPDTALRP